MNFLDPDPSVKPLGPIFSSWPLGLHDFRVFLDLDPSVKCHVADGEESFVLHSKVTGY